jgi:hypothetical protein
MRRGNPEREIWIDEEILVGAGAIIAIGGGRAWVKREYTLPKRP